MKLAQRLRQLVRGSTIKTDPDEGKLRRKAERQRRKDEAKLNQQKEKQSAKLVQQKTDFWQEKEWADRHLARVGERPRNVSQPVLQKIVELIPSGSSIMDVGCGHGRYSLSFAEAGHRVVATDISSRMLELLEGMRGNLPVEIRLADASRLPGQDGEFDVVFSNDFMGHFPNWATLLGEQTRVCRKGGSIIYSMAFREHRELTTKFEGKGFEHDYSPELKSDKPFWVETSRDALQAACVQHGLEVSGLYPLRFLSENFLLGEALGTEAYTAFKRELIHRLDTSEEAQRFYSWLENTALQHLPFQMSYLTLVHLVKR